MLKKIGQKTVSIISLVLLLSNIFLPFTYAADATVTATVPANVSSFQFNFQQITQGDTFSSNSPIQYEITYGNRSAIPQSLTITANWTTGTIQDGSGTVDVVDYIQNSATVGYNSTAPVIDQVNKSITWTVSSIPANTLDQVVDFSLKTNQNYTGSSRVKFSVSSYLSGVGVTTQPSTIDEYMVNASSTPSSASSTSSTHTTIPSPVPTSILSAPVKFTIQSLAVDSISESGITFFVTISAPAQYTVQYGLSPHTLTQSFTSLSAASHQTISLTGLKSATPYYFQIRETDTAGNTVVSDIYTATTAQKSVSPMVNLSSIIATSDNVIITGSEPTTTLNNKLILPTNTHFMLRFQIQAGTSIQSVDASIRNGSVLGLSTFISQIQAADLYTHMGEVSPYVYQGHLQTPKKDGIYEVFIRITDTAGNISEQKVLELYNKHPFMVTDTQHNPLENARVYLSWYNSRLKTFATISHQQFLLQNPSYTNSSGELSLVLPNGKYKARVDAIGYSQQTIFFDINPLTPTGYPLVELKKKFLTPITYIEYYGSTLSDLLGSMNLFINSLSGSSRVFNLLAFISICILVCITFVAYLSRIKIPISSLAAHLHHIVHKNRTVISGKIITEANTPLSLVDVFLLNTNRKILDHAQTKSNGSFRFLAPDSSEHILIAVKKGFITVHHALTESTAEIILSQNVTKSPFLHTVFWYVHNLLDVSFEALLLFSVVFECFLAVRLGVIATLPLFGISGLNLLLWTTYVRRIRENNEEL